MKYWPLDEQLPNNERHKYHIAWGAVLLPTGKRGLQLTSTNERSGLLHLISRDYGKGGGFRTVGVPKTRPMACCSVTQNLDPENMVHVLALT